MNQNQTLSKNVAALVIFLVTTAASLYLILSIRMPELIPPTLFSSQESVVLVSFFSFACVVFFSLNRRQNLPLLVLILLIKVLQFPISLFLKKVGAGDVALYYYLSSALIDLLMAFAIVHYHNDSFLMRLFKVTGRINVPQVFIMASLLAISSLVSCLQAMEFIIYTQDKSFYGDSLPFFYQHQLAIKLTLKTLFDICIWSLLLDADRWRVLRKIQRIFAGT